MVFTSMPSTYLDAANWQQQQQQNHHQQQGNGGSTSQQQLLPPPPPPPPPQGGNSGSIRPGSMADRARMANLPMPETSLKCPRCESTNTKFCYFNNYSLSQPRHFCKTCRRYWTRGGALRNVPVGGGFRRNKRSKGSSSSTKSPASSDRQAGSTSSANSISSHNTDIAGFAVPPQMQPLRFMAPLHHQFNEFGGGDIMGLNYGYGQIGEFGIGSALGGSDLEQWRMPQMQQQFPYLEGNSLSHASNMYPFEGSVSHNEVITSGYVRPKIVSTSGVITQLACVKMEDSNRELNLSNTNHLFGINSSNNIHQGSEQYWTSSVGIGGDGGGTSAIAWTDISAFSSSSNTSNNI